MLNRYHFERATFEYQLKEFAAREIRFRIKFLGQTCASIARDASLGDENIAPSTVSKLANGETKHPQARTLIAILMALGFDFDVVKLEVAETTKPTIGDDGKVVAIGNR